jgi:putative inorganic carbon (HCO3(-)) transporter
MPGLTRTMHDVYEKSEGRLGTSWPIALLAIVLYAGAAFMLATRVRLPSPMHLAVYLMGVAIVVLTIAKVEWGLQGLAIMIPFSRPGFTLGADKVFHVSGLNVALVGVALVYVLRYFADKPFASKGPFLRRTSLDPAIWLFISLLTFSMLSGMNKNPTSLAKARVLLYYKEYVFYFVWFYLSVTLLRKPEDVRRYAILFAASGLFVALLGLRSRFTGGLQMTDVTEAELEAGAIGGRTRGGWFGLGHANVLGAFLLMTVPVWFFASAHLRKAWQRLAANFGIIIGFIGLLFTYSRSAWGGVAIGIGMLGLRDRRALLRIIVFMIIFAIAAQAIAVTTSGMGVVELIARRFEQLERSGFSGRPDIFRAGANLVRDNPLVGVGPGAFGQHSVSPSGASDKILHAHNVFLNSAAEFGLPAACIFTGLIIALMRMAWRNVGLLRRAPGYAFVAQGTFAAFFSIVVQSMFVHTFYHRETGYAFFTLTAIIVALNRVARDETLLAPSATRPSGKAWTDS